MVAHWSGPFDGPEDDREGAEPAITAIDAVMLREVELRAIVVHLAGSRDPAVRNALTRAVRRVLDRTRHR